MRKASLDLYQLIKSLSKAEKAYISRMAARTSKADKTGYFRLFQAIDSMTEYNEEYLKACFAGEAVAGYLSRAKNYLYSFILELLSAQRRRNDTEAMLRNLIGQMEVLFDRGLFKQCDAVRRKAIALAEKRDKEIYLLELLSWEARIVSMLGHHTPENNQRVVDASAQMTAILENALQSHRYCDLHLRIRRTFKHPFDLRDPAIRTKVLQLLQSPLLDNRPEELTPEAQRYYYKLHVLHARITDDSDKAYYYSQRSVEFEADFIDLHNGRPEGYIETLCNHTWICTTQGNYTEACETIERILTIPLHTPTIEYTAYKMYYGHKLHILIWFGEIREAYTIERNILALQQRFEGTINKNTAHILYYLLALLHFGVGNYQKAAAYIDQVLGDLDPGSTLNDFYCRAQILHVLIHYELDNFDILEYCVKLTWQYLERRRELFEYEMTILDCLRTMSVLHNANERRGVLRRLRVKLQELKIKLPYYSFPHLFDTEVWIDSKLENKTYFDVLRVRIGEQNYVLDDNVDARIEIHNNGNNSVVSVADVVNGSTS